MHELYNNEYICEVWAKIWAPRQWEKQALMNTWIGDVPSCTLFHLLISGVMCTREKTIFLEHWLFWVCRSTAFGLPPHTKSSPQPRYRSNDNDKNGTQQTEIEENCVGKPCQVMIHPWLDHLVSCCRTEDHPHVLPSLTRLGLCLVKILLCSCKGSILESKSVSRPRPQAFTRPPRSGPPYVIVVQLTLLQR